MNLQLFADSHAGPFWGYSFSEVLVGIVILAGLIAVVTVILRWLEIKIPQPAIHILWIIGVVLLGVIALRFIASIW